MKLTTCPYYLYLCIPNKQQQKHGFSEKFPYCFNKPEDSLLLLIVFNQWMKESSVFERRVPSLLHRSDVVLLFEAHSQISNCFNVEATMEEKLSNGDKSTEWELLTISYQLSLPNPNNRRQTRQPVAVINPGQRRSRPFTLSLIYARGSELPFIMAFVWLVSVFLQENTTRQLPVPAGQTTQPPQFSCPSGRNVSAFIFTHDALHHTFGQRRV